MLSISDLKLGKVIKINNDPYQIIYTKHIKVARSSAVLKTKLKNLVSGVTLEKTFSGSDTIEEADISRSKADFLYSHGNFFFFIDNKNFEQFQFHLKDLGDLIKYLKENQEVEVLIFNDLPVSIALPKKVILEVSFAPDGVKGNSSGATTKVVVLETDFKIKVPLFIKTGDKIKINTETGEYVERI